MFCSGARANDLQHNYQIILSVIICFGLVGDTQTRQHRTPSSKKEKEKERKKKRKKKEKQREKLHAIHNMP